VGAWAFEQYADGSDVAAAFRAARDAAVVEHGHGGYSGSIAEKHDYVVITRQVMDLHDAYRLARELIERQDSRVDDKWGPAGAIPVRGAHPRGRRRRPARRPRRQRRSERRRPRAHRADRSGAGTDQRG
jgi:hypothetical protein